MFEAVETLRKAGTNISDAFNKGLKQRWISKQVSFLIVLILFN
jgi:hypothetical protein